MKVINIFLIIAISGLASAGPFVNNPRMVAQEQAQNAFKVTGVHTRGIVHNVNDVQDEVERIKRGVDELHRSLNAPFSPFARLLRLATNFDVFARGSRELLNDDITEADSIRLLESRQQRDEMIATLTSMQQKKQAQSLYATFELLVAEMDTLMFHAIVHHMRYLLYEVAGLLDTIIHIRDYAGKFSTDVLDLDLVNQAGVTARGIRVLARKLQEIMAGGSHMVGADRALFAQAVIEHQNNLSNLVRDLQSSLGGMQSALGQLRGSLPVMTRQKNQLIRAATMMQKRLIAAMTNTQRGSSGDDLLLYAQQEIQTMMRGMHSPLIAVLHGTAALLAALLDGMRASIEGIDAFKKQIEFDVVNPVVRVDIDALPDLMNDLSRTLGPLRSAV